MNRLLVRDSTTAGTAQPQAQSSSRTRRRATARRDELARLGWAKSVPLRPTAGSPRPRPRSHGARGPGDGGSASIIPAWTATMLSVPTSVTPSAAGATAQRPGSAGPTRQAPRPRSAKDGAGQELPRPRRRTSGRGGPEPRRVRRRRRSQRHDRRWRKIRAAAGSATSILALSGLSVVDQVTQMVEAVADWDAPPGGRQRPAGRRTDSAALPGSRSSAAEARSAQQVQRRFAGQAAATRGAGPQRVTRRSRGARSTRSRRRAALVALPTRVHRGARLTGPAEHRPAHVPHLAGTKKPQEYLLQRINDDLHAAPIVMRAMIASIEAQRDSFSMAAARITPGPDGHDHSSSTGARTSPASTSRTSGATAAGG